MAGPTTTTGVWRRRRVAYRVGHVALFVAIAFYVGPNLILFGKPTGLAPSDFVPVARDRCEPIVRAIKAYRRDHGRLPDGLEPLVPEYLPTRSYPGDMWDGELNYWTRFNHTIVYRFAPAEEGWYVWGVFANGPIPLPPVAAAPAAGPAATAPTSSPATSLSATRDR